MLHVSCLSLAYWFQGAVHQLDPCSYETFTFSCSLCIFFLYVNSVACINEDGSPMACINEDGSPIGTQIVSVRLQKYETKDGTFVFFVTSTKVVFYGGRPQELHSMQMLCKEVGTQCQKMLRYVLCEVCMNGGASCLKRLTYCSLDISGI